VRIDRAGQTSKRFAGTSGSPLAESEARCPLWTVHAAFDRPGNLVVQLVELEDGTRWLTLSRTVTPQGGRYGGVQAEFAIGLGVAAELAGGLAVARGLDLTGEATPIGPGCRACGRGDCPQRSASPTGRAMLVNERERGISAFSFGGD
jgi:hypothetical protein